MGKRSFKVVIVMSTLVLIAGVSLTISYLKKHGFSARVKPHPLEEAFALTVRKLVTPSAFKKT